MMKSGGRLQPNASMAETMRLVANMNPELIQDLGPELQAAIRNGTMEVKQAEELEGIEEVQEVEYGF